MYHMPSLSDTHISLIFRSYNKYGVIDLRTNPMFQLWTEQHAAINLKEQLMWLHVLALNQGLSRGHNSA